MDYSEIPTNPTNACIEVISREDAKVSLYPVTKMFFVFLRCPVCGTDMEKLNDGWHIEHDTHEFYYDYVCPKCGKILKSKTQYPFQNFQYDKGAEYQIVATEAELHNGRVF